MHKTILLSFALLSMMALLVPMTFAATSPIVKQVTGGGWILDEDCSGNPDKKTFGFNAEELADGTLRGNVEFVEHGPFGGQERGYPHVHGYTITAITFLSDKEAWIYGICRLNGDNTPREFAVHVIDQDEPGKHDWFGISIPSIGYDVGAELGFPGDAGGGGNIQVHRVAP